MLLRFADGTKLNIRSIIGAPQDRHGAIRDVLTIEVDPVDATLDELQQIFSDKTKTSSLSAVTISFITNGNHIEKKEITNQIGENYTIFLSIKHEVRDIPRIGNQEPQTEDVNIVEIAQMTYMEIKLEQMTEEV